MKLSRMFFVLLLVFAISATFPGDYPVAEAKKPDISRKAGNSASKIGYGRSANFDRLVASTAVVAPLGINPLMALAGLGVAAYWGHWPVPGGLEFIANPWVWGSFLLIGFLLQFGRSFKLTKPFAELLGTGETFLGMASIALTVLPVAALAPSGIQQAGIMSNIGLLIFALLALSVINVLRIALDVLIWLSPFPFVDGLFQMLKLFMTAGLILLAIFAPWVAFALNLVIIVIALFTLRWAIRLTYFAGTIVSDLTWRRWTSEREELPQALDSKTDFGPILVFNSGFKKWPKRRRLYLSFLNDDWVLMIDKESTDLYVLGAGSKVLIRRTILGATLNLEDENVLIPPRYNHLLDQMAQISGSRIEGFTTGFGKSSSAALG